MEEYDKYKEFRELTRRELCMAPNITLNGKPAAITGWADERATVFQHDTEMSAVFSWMHVSEVVNADGNFFGTIRYIPTLNDDLTIGSAGLIKDGVVTNTVPAETTVTATTSVNTDPVYGNPHADPAFAHVYTSTDDVRVEYTAEPDDDGSMVTVRRTVWSKHRNARGRHILWQDTAMVLHRDQMADFIRDMVVSVVV